MLIACRGSANNNAVDSATAGGDSGSGTVKIQAVQNDAMPPGTPVSLAGVVVTAIDSFGAKTGNFWVEEPEGGPFSGVLVYNAPIASVAALTVGAIVSITGAEKAEFALTGSNADTTGRTDTELEPVTGGKLAVTMTGTGTVPAPSIVDALTIGQLADADAQGSAFSAGWEQWEGVLITVNNVAAQSAPKSFGSTTPVPADNYDMAITGVIKAETSLAAFPDGITRNTCFASVTGVEDYFYDYLLLPRSTNDVVLGGTGCPQPESSMTACTDTIDNDANGFSDCADDNCMVGYSGCRTTTTIAAVDTALPSGGIEVDNGYVTAISADGKNFWMATSLTASSGNGLYVYGGGTTLPTTSFTVGAQVSVIGTVEDYKPTGNTATQVLRELDGLQVTVSTPGTVAGTGVSGQATAALTVEATGRPYVGSLVTLTNVKVVTLGTAATFNAGSLTQGGTTFESAGDVYVLASGVGTCFASITGIWTYDVHTNVFALEPLAEGTSGGTCN